MSRNDKILVAILKGYTLVQVGSVFKITGERAKQIAVETVRKYDNNLYLKVMESFATGSIKEFRKYKNRLISIVANELHE